MSSTMYILPMYTWGPCTSLCTHDTACVRHFVHMIRPMCVTTYTTYEPCASLFLCTHEVSEHYYVHMIRHVCVTLYTWYGWCALLYIHRIRSVCVSLHTRYGRCASLCIKHTDRVRHNIHSIWAVWVTMYTCFRSCASHGTLQTPNLRQNRPQTGNTTS